ncbi:MAG: hypothetical protein KJ609_00085 [Gammaproteobacteria bacterium]|nr:hypothetical protein [Gammaproteobacteria bacterium]MBU2238453.1 hypothetical protein [Gammaproteobacteria bacterium]MBU2316930.1 hypothetical protein [Gammaproteobacteria bacterium]
MTYEETTLKELEAEFRCSVDEYLLSCEEFGRDVQQPCIGSCNIRTGEVLHREANVHAQKTTDIV